MVPTWMILVVHASPSFLFILSIHDNGFFFLSSFLLFAGVCHGLVVEVLFARFVKVRILNPPSKHSAAPTILRFILCFARSEQRTAGSTTTTRIARRTHAYRSDGNPLQQFF